MEFIEFWVAGEARLRMNYSLHVNNSGWDALPAAPNMRHGIEINQIPFNFNVIIN